MTLLSRRAAAGGVLALCLFLFAGCGGGGGNSALSTALPPAQQAPNGDVLPLQHRLRAGTITEYGGTLDAPVGITSGPRGALWFTQDDSPTGKISYSTTAGVIKDVGTGLYAPDGIVALPHDTLWFTQVDGSGVGEITSHGQLSTIAAPQGFGTIVVDPDGNLWYGAYPNLVVKLTPAGSSTSYTNACTPNPRSCDVPGVLTADKAGNIWFACATAGYLCKITTAGATTQYGSGSLNVFGAAAGPGGVWFTDAGFSGGATGKIGKIASNGTITEYGGTLAVPGGITEGPDGAMWFTEGGIATSAAATRSGKIGRIAANGTISEYGGSLADPTDIVVGPDGKLWFTERGAFVDFTAIAASTGKIGTIVPL